MNIRILVWVLALVLTFGCALKIDKAGLRSSMGVAQVGEDCVGDGDDYSCDEVVASEGFSEGLVGFAKDAVMGVVGFFVPSAVPAEPTPVIVRVERPGPSAEE